MNHFVIRHIENGFCSWSFQAQHKRVEYKMYAWLNSSDKYCYMYVI